MRTLSIYILVIFTASLAFLNAGCTVYRSPERKDFEAEYTNFKVKNLKIKSCSHQSVIQQATASKLVYIEPEKYSIWEHQVDSASLFESNNFKGDYCIYEYFKSDV